MDRCIGEILQMVKKFMPEFLGNRMPAFFFRIMIMTVIMLVIMIIIGCILGLLGKSCDPGSSTECRNN